jgi:hypothetical protein
LSAQPSGRVTCDVSGASSAKENIRVFDLMSKLITTLRRHQLAASIDSAAFTAAEAALIAKINPGSIWTVGIGYAVDRSRELGRCAQPHFVRWIRLVRPDAGRCRDLRSDRYSRPRRCCCLEDGRCGEVVERQLRVPEHAHRTFVGTLQYDPQSNVQTDGLATSLDPYFRNLYGVQYKSKTSTALGGTAYTTNWGLYHKTKLVGQIYVSRLVPLTSGANNTYSDGTITQKWIDAASATRPRTTDWSRSRPFCRRGTGVSGDIVKVTYPRHGFAAGVNCALIGVEPDYSPGP